jgi:hypothetical protein
VSDLTCPSCGARLLAAAGHAGAEASCPACGDVIVVPGTPSPQAPERSISREGREPEGRWVNGRADDGEWNASPAPSGAVPPPRASSAGTDAQLPLALAAASLLIPILGPLAWWLVQRASQPIRERGEEEPDSIRHARFMAMTGTVLLGLLLLCCSPMLLVIG